MIPFNKPYLSGNELEYIRKAATLGQLSGDGHFTKLSKKWLDDYYSPAKTLLTHSCTGALEIAALLLELEPGDEIILPSYTFVSSANAFVLRGATPVFVDVDPVNFCIDVHQVRKAITSKTKAILCVHYAGLSCDMTTLVNLSKEFSIPLIEDAAQAFGSTYKGRKLGTFGDLATFSFHETKNIISGEGGCLLVNNQKYYNRAEIIREKGTNRSSFFRGQTDKYTWIDLGSSFLPGELISAFLLAQLESSSQILNMRLNLWNSYYKMLQSLQEKDKIKLPFISGEISHNAHMFFVLCSNLIERQALIKYLRDQGIQAVFHYVPLHSSPAGQRFGRISGKLQNTIKASDCLLRLPLFPNLSSEQVLYICSAIESFYTCI
ncbi:dTDP-4-amino-4,6-dideoxygalactose transaminase [Prochlorococcus sp. MIT 1300]|uniref:dTDP-4-amino-4,6-dideoxygalactose transaminase n=1 Tax=Prochlorococcus sp. MIT 1300 TaxID=3096218 RepID=UPI002A76256C|nr:dTDP-4-amino-4,6-dideoxygalactose transaminase [Prochlorococcus sp. MIT 1300]